MEALRDSEEYRSFLCTIPRKQVLVEEWSNETWTLYDGGPRERHRPPLLFLPPLSGRADSYYRQMLPLAGLGFHVISADWPPLWSVDEFCMSLERLLDTLDIPQVHIFGASLGGYLAQCFAETRPSRVASLLLCNSFADTRIFARTSTASMYWAVPGWLLKRLVLSGLPRKALAPPVTRALDFMVEGLESLSQPLLASRFHLNCCPGFVDTKRIRCPVMLLDVLDECALSESAREFFRAAYPKARLATLKHGGNFPFLASPDQTNLFIRVHLNALEDSGPGNSS